MPRGFDQMFGDDQSPVPIPSSEREVQAQLDRITNQLEGDIPARALKFLRYIVEETLAGRANRIKAYTVGVEVFDRDPKFDAQSDPVVRIEAGRLRRALERYYLGAGQNDIIRISIPKGGYVPSFEMREGADGGRAPTPTAPLGAVAPRSPLTRGGWIGVAAILAVVVPMVSLGWISLSGKLTQSVEKPEPPSVSGPTLLVTPFANLGAGSEAKIYAEGLHEEILGQLAGFKEIRVVGRETSRTIQTDAELARVRSELGIGFVLEGSVRASPSHVRVLARLIDAQAGRILWSQAYDDDLQLRDLFKIQEDVAQKVATALAQPYGVLFRAEGAEQQAQRPDDLDSYACSLNFYEYRTALSPDGHAGIRACLERTVALYPRYATARAMLAIIYLDEERYGFNPRKGPPNALGRAMESARLAIRLDPDNARALQSMMMVLFFAQQPKEALEMGERAVKQNPNDTELLAEFGTRLGQAGAWERSTEVMQLALDRNPGHSAYYSGSLALNAYMQHDYTRARTLIRQSGLVNFPLYHFVAAIIYAQLGMRADAREARDQFLQMRPNIFEQWDTEMARRNFRPEDAVHLADGARKAGFPVPETTVAETLVRPGPQR